VVGVTLGKYSQETNKPAAKQSHLTTNSKRVKFIYWISKKNILNIYKIISDFFTLCNFFINA